MQAPLTLLQLGYISMAIGLLLLTYGVLKARAQKNQQIEYVTLRVILPKKESQKDKENATEQNFKETIDIMDQLYQNIHHMDEFKAKKLRPRKHISMEIVGEEKAIYFHVTCHFSMESSLEKLISSTYPGAHVEPLYDYRYFHDDAHQEYLNLQLKKPSYYPLKKLENQEADPENSVINAFSKLNENETAFMQILVRPQDHKWNDQSHKNAQTLYKGKKKGFTLWDFVKGNLANNDKAEEREELTPQQQDNVKEIEQKIGQPCFATNIRLVASSPNTVRVKTILRDIASALGHFNTIELNSFSAKKPSKVIQTRRKKLNKTLFRMWIPSETAILSVEELAQLYHFPDSRFNKSNLISFQQSKVFPPPENLPNNGILLGHNVYRGRVTPVYVHNEDRFRHFYVIGQTGQGKSSVALTMARQDIEKGNGICVMDPHGELAEDIIDYIPKERAEDVIYFNAGDENFPLGINLLEPKNDTEKDLLASELNNIFLKLYGSEIWSPTLQEWGMQAALALMDDEEEGGSITDIVPMFTNKEFQQKKRERIKNEIVKMWWDNTHDKSSQQEKERILPFFSSKFNSFVANSTMRNIVGQSKSAFDFYDAMNQNKIILVNLAKGVIGEQNMQLLGMIFINKIQMATMARAKVSKQERTDFIFYIDEMQNFVSPTIGSILSEVRKYRLGMVMMHQYINQLNDKGDTSVRDAVFGNV